MTLTAYDSSGMRLATRDRHGRAGTFKLKKNDLRVEGYDPQQVARSAAAAQTRRSRTISGPAAEQPVAGEPRADRLFYLDVAQNEYKPITPEVFEQIKASRIKF